MRCGGEVDDMKISCGTSNVFADLGYADADERQNKLRLALSSRAVFKSLLTFVNLKQKIYLKVNTLEDYNHFSETTFLLNIN